MFKRGMGTRNRLARGCWSSVKICRSCGTNNDEPCENCASCGLVLCADDLVYCLNCGCPSPLESLYCSKCGKLFDEPVPSTDEHAPEALEFVNYMGFWIRLGAYSVDVLMFLSLSFAILPNIGIQLSDLNTNLFVTIAGGVYRSVFTGLSGQTIGKMIFKIRVVDFDGTQPSLKTAFFREIPCKILAEFLLFIGFIWVAFDREKQGLHDKIVGTHVVKA